jgi:hypothetical protein
VPRRVYVLARFCCVSWPDWIIAVQLGMATSGLGAAHG